MHPAAAASLNYIDSLLRNVSEGPVERRRSAFEEEADRQPLRLPLCGSTIDQFDYLHWLCHSQFSVSLTVYRCQDRRGKHLPAGAVGIGD